MQIASLAFPALDIISQQIPYDRALDLTVDVMPRLPRTCMSSY